MSQLEVDKEHPSPNRYHGKVNMSEIHEIGMDELCVMMGEGIDSVHEALIAGDYIEEVVNTACYLTTTW